MLAQVALVDADIGLRNLDLLLGLENRILYTAIDILEGECRLDQASALSRTRIRSSCRRSRSSSALLEVVEVLYSRSSSNALSSRRSRSSKRSSSTRSISSRVLHLHLNTAINILEGDCRLDLANLL
jgi:hypothetical protein